MMVLNWRNGNTVIYEGKTRNQEGKSARPLHVSLGENPIESLKRICERYEFTAITIYDDYDHAVFRKFDFALTDQTLNDNFLKKCMRAQGYKCTTFVWDKYGETPEDKNNSTQNSMPVATQNQDPPSPEYNPQQMYQSLKNFSPVVNSQPQASLPYGQVPPPPQIPNEINISINNENKNENYWGV